jgi:hypothetical protein
MIKRSSLQIMKASHGKSILPQPIAPYGAKAKNKELTPTLLTWNHA